MENKKILVLTAITLIFALFMALSGNSKDILSKSEYDLGEKVKINLKEISDYKIKIITPSTSYNLIGSEEELIFRPEETGNYQIFLQYENVREEYSFKVNGENIEGEIINKNLIETNSTNLGEENKTRQEIDYKGVINQPYKWTIEEEIDSPSEKLKIKVPYDAENITLLNNGRSKISKIEKNHLTNKIGSFIGKDNLGKTTISIDNPSEELLIEYYTQAPISDEEIISENKKQVKITSPDHLHYEKVLAYTHLPQEVESGSNITLLWRNENTYIDFIAEDKDNNGLIDYIQWVVPHLSEQVFEITLFEGKNNFNYEIKNIEELDGKVYQKGDKLKLNFELQGNYEIKISTPTKYFSRLGSNDFFILNLDNPGNYEIEFWKGGGVKYYRFNVVNPNYEITQISNYAGEPIRWSKKINESKILLPDYPIFNISIINENDIKYQIIKENNKTYLLIEGDYHNARLNYYTENPKIVENQINIRQKEVKISASDIYNYTNIKAYTSIEELTSNTNNIKVYWRNENTYIDFIAEDKDNNGLIDYIQWVVPHLSEQVFDIIIISNAEELDNNKVFIRDIYDYVKERDDIWTQISDGNYIRVKFEKNLTSVNDITIYAKSTSPNAKIEVYEKDSISKLAEFSEIDEDQKYQIFLTNLENSQDTFDLKIFGDIEFDHIIDPTIAGFCTGVFACYTEGGVIGDCSCTQVNSDDGTYFGITSGNKGLESKSNNIAQGGINITNSTIVPPGAGITNATLYLNYLVGANSEACSIHYSTDGAITWTALRSDCTLDTTETTRIFDLSTLSESELENILINFTLRESGNSKNVFKMDYLNLTVTYLVAGADLNVTLNYPGNNEITNYRNVFFNYTPGSSSGNYQNCSLYTNGTTNFVYDQANTTQIINNNINQFGKLFTKDGTFLWNVLCIDDSGEEFAVVNNSFSIDTFGPNISLVYPANDSTISDPFKLNFVYNTTDTISNVQNCSIYVNGISSGIDNTITENINQSISKYLSNGINYWQIQCSDQVGNVGISEIRTVNISLSIPEIQERFWETYPSGFQEDEIAYIWLNNTRDPVQNGVRINVPGSTGVNVFEAASHIMGNNGAIIPSGTTIDFSASFNVSSSSVDVTWKLYQITPLSTILLCQNGNDLASGISTSGTTVSQNTTCISSDIRLNQSDQIILSMNAYNTHPTQLRTITHVWDGTGVTATSSYVDVNITTEGYVKGNLTYPLVDQNIGQASTFEAACEAYCTIGLCRNTYAYIQTNITGSDYANINTTGNLILDAGETNPHYLGNLTTNPSTTNFTILGDIESTNNIRCIFISDYDNYNGTKTTEISIGATGAQAPRVNITSPENNTWVNTSEVVLYYNATDINGNIANSTLILNGARYQTNQSEILDGQINNFTLTLADGSYNWTVNVTDTTNLEGTDNKTFSLYIDTRAPQVNLLLPENNTPFYISAIEFNFTASDNLDSILTCNISIDGTPRDENIPLNNGSSANRTISPISIGDHVWDVICIDQAGNRNTSQTWNFSVSDLPPTLLLITQNNTFNNSRNISLYYNATDNNGLLQSILILNGEFNQTNQSEILNGQINNFTLTNLLEEVYTWKINLTDTGGFNATNETRTFTIDYSAPNIYLNFPDNASNYNTSSIYFNFNISDNFDSSLSCDMFVGNISDSFIGINGTPTNRPISNLIDGYQFWNVSCIDDSGNRNTSITRSINITEYPVIQLNTPNNSFFNQSTFNLTYTPSDNTNISSCSIFIDGNFNQSNPSAIANGNQQNFSLTASPGVYTWQVYCNDTINLENNSIIKTFTVDLNGLFVETIYPEPGANLFTKTLNISYNVTDDIDNLLQCDVRINNIIEDTYNATKGAITNRTLSFSKGGFKLWNVTCYDDAFNSYTSETRNFTLAFAPFVNTTFPENGTWINTSEIALYYNATDDNQNIANATLILNGSRYQTNQSEILDGQINNFTLTLADGHYIWTVNVTDTTNLESSDNISKIFHIDTGIPNITLREPQENATLDWNNITFNFTIYDNMDYYPVCNLTIDDGGGPTIELENINTINFDDNLVYLSKQDGDYQWYVECVDDAGNRNISETRNFTVEAPPRVRIWDPTQNEQFNTNDITFTYLPEDIYGLFNCSIFLDGEFNATDEDVEENINNTFLIQNIAEGRHNATVQCQDVFPDFNLGISNITNFTVDTIPPSIFLNYPKNNTNTLRTVEFNFTAMDSLDSDGNLSCNLYLDNILNQTGIIAPNNTAVITEIGLISLGGHTWNVTCLDEAGNTNSSFLYNFNVTLPDLMLNDSSITFNNTSPTENESIMINAEIYNLVNVTVKNITVQFYEGDPDTTGVQIGENQTINQLAGFSNTTINISWHAVIGTTDIFVVVDPLISAGGRIEELSELNNEANTSITTGAWQFVVGDIDPNSEFELSDGNASSVIKWPATNFEDGNIYVTDSEAIISWTTLKAVGRDTSDILTNDDFSDIDSLLGMTTYYDSVSNLYANSSGHPQNTTDYIIFNNQVTNVPIANSTNNTNFFTGILWDYSTDTNTEYGPEDQEDLIFITELNKNQIGSYGTYDYEIRIPARLREYHTVETKGVVFYTEIR